MRKIVLLSALTNLGLRPPEVSSVPGCAKAPWSTEGIWALPILHLKGGNRWWNDNETNPESYVNTLTDSILNGMMKKTWFLSVINRQMKKKIKKFQIEYYRISS